LGRGVADAVRDSSIEIVRNAFIWGGARSANVVISASAVTIEDDGAPFNNYELRRTSK